MTEPMALQLEIPTPRRRRPESYAAEAKFRARLEALGATLLDPYMGGKRRHRVICAEGHECTPLAERVAAGGGVCRTCSGRDSNAAWTAFQARVRELGGTLLESEWKGNQAKYKIRCKEGHISYPRPGRVAGGVGICRTCAGLDPDTARLRFMDRLASEGIAALSPYEAANKWVSLRCAAGHEFRGKPSHVVRVGSVVCRSCRGADPDSQLARLRQAVEDQAGELLEQVWLGAHRGHTVRCEAGHLRQVIPSKILAGRSLCAECKGYTPEALARQFVEAVEELGGTPLDAYMGATKPHRVRCAEGHVSTPTPHHLLQGGGLCRFCAGKAWDVLYVVQDDVLDVVKFGITSGNPRPRLQHHARHGLDRVIRLHTGLPRDTAPALERTILGALRDAGEVPVHGREYFPARVLPVILDLVDNHPAVRTHRPCALTPLPGPWQPAGS